MKRNHHSKGESNQKAHSNHVSCTPINMATSENLASFDPAMKPVNIEVYVLRRLFVRQESRDG